jgi:hypothetical protein
LLLFFVSLAPLSSFPYSYSITVCF